MSGKIKLMMLVLVASLCLTACGRDKEQTQQTSPPAGEVKSQTEPPPPVIIPVAGKVLEILDTGGFVFISLDWNGKQVWATVPAVDLKVGEIISLDHATMLDKGFYSNALKRNFEKMIMASGVEGKSPRNRPTKGGNSKDPNNRRSGKLMAIPSPAQTSPAGKARP